MLSILPKFFRKEDRSSLKNGATPFVATGIPEQLLLQQLFRSASSASGINVTPLRALGVATVYACVRVLASTIATLPIGVYRRLPNGGRELDTAHPLYDLLHNEPHPAMTSTDLRMALEGKRALHNNAFAIITRDGGEGAVSIQPLGDGVTIHGSDTNGAPMYRVNGSVYYSDEILHLKGFTRNGIWGDDLITTVNDVIGLAIALEENAGRFFRNNSRPGGVLSHPASLSDKAFERLRQEIENKHQGAENAYKLMILEEGLKYEASRTDNKDAQFDESRDRQDRAIARIFGVPPHKVGLISTMPRANVEQENISFVVDTIRPICVAWEQELNKKLLNKAERRTHFIEFNLEGLLRGDMESRYKSYATARQWGFLNVNEIRRKENLNPIGAQGDIYLQPVNMTPADETEN